MNINDKYKTIQEWAWAYYNAGWNVVPLYNFSKNPQFTKVYTGGLWVQGWKDLQSRRATEQEMRYWFEENKPTGLGVITGKISGIVAIDVDSYKTGGMEFHLDSPLKARSARGGTHFYFKYEEPVKTTGLKDGVFIEVKSDGGFIVLPPSSVWVDETAKKMGVYRWEVANTKLNVLPPIHPDDLTRYQKGTTVYHDMHTLIGAELGEQHNNLRTIVLKTLGRFPKSEWDIAESVLWKLAQDFKPPHPTSRIQKMLRDCKDYLLRTSSIADAQPYVDPKSVASVAKSRIEEKSLEKDAPSTGWPELDNLIKGFIPGHLYTMTGETNVGKTSVACNFAVRIAQQGKRVLYYALEPENTVVDYIASVRTNKMFSELTEQEISFDDPNIHIYGKEEIGSFADLVLSLKEARQRYDLVVIDHIGYFVRKTEGVIQEQSNVVKELAGLAKEKRMAILLIAHLRKPPARRKKDYIPTADDISGSASFKQDSTEVLIMIRKPDPNDPDGIRLSDQGMLYVTKTKVGPNGSIPLQFAKYKSNVLTPQTIRLLQNPVTQKQEVVFDEADF